MREQVMKMLESLGEDAYVRVMDDSILVDVFDWDGGDEDDFEALREYDEDKCDAVFDWLSEHCVSEGGDLYRYFEFDGFEVIWGYTSYDI